MARRPPDLEGTHSLLVLNISFRTTPEDLRNEFGRFGNLADVYIPRSHGNSRGYAFVRYYNKEEADNARREMDKKTLDNREIGVQIAKYGRNEHATNRYNRRSPPNNRYRRERSFSPRRGGGGYDNRYNRDRDRDRERDRGDRYARYNSPDRRRRSRSPDYKRFRHDYDGERGRPEYRNSSPNRDDRDFNRRDRGRDFIRHRDDRDPERDRDAPRPRDERDDRDSARDRDIHRDNHHRERDFDRDPQNLERSERERDRDSPRARDERDHDRERDRGFSRAKDTNYANDGPNNDEPSARNHRGFDDSRNPLKSESNIDDERKPSANISSPVPAALQDRR